MRGQEVRMTSKSGLYRSICWTVCSSISLESARRSAETVCVNQLALRASISWHRVRQSVKDCICVGLLLLAADALYVDDGEGGEGGSVTSLMTAEVPAQRHRRQQIMHLFSTSEAVCGYCDDVCVTSNF